MSQWTEGGKVASGRLRMNLGGRYWPKVIHVDPPLLDDGSVDVRALLQGWDDAYNEQLIGGNTCS